MPVAVGMKRLGPVARRAIFVSTIFRLKRRVRQQTSLLYFAARAEPSVFGRG
jgi:hypothetical protein